MDSLMHFKSRQVAYLLAVFSLVLITACGGNDNADTGAIGSGGRPEYTLAAEQVLRLSMSAEPGTIDPHLSSVGNEISIVRQLSTGLFAYDERLNLVPALAKALPTLENGGVSPDGLTYTIDLKPSTWSDGSALTANDFVYSLLRALDPTTASPYAWAFYGIAGAFEYNTSLNTEDGKPAPPASVVEDLRSKVGVKAKGDYRLVYTLNAPSASFLNVLALVTAFPVKQGVIEQYGDAWTEPGYFVGNGPFVLSSWDRGSKIVLGRNDGWYGPAPTLSRLEVSFIADDAVAYNAYVSGQLDAVRATPASLAGKAHVEELDVTPQLGTYAVFMNNAKAPFDNALVRQAFGSAIDREAYVGAVLQGAGAPATSWVPPGMPGYADNLGLGLAFEPARAQDLLAQAGYPGGEGLPEVKFILPAADHTKLAGQFIEQQLETNLGVQVSFEYLEQGQYFEAFMTGNFDATVQSWFADWPSPENFLYGLFHSQGGANVIGYGNPNYDKLLDDAVLAGNPQARLDFFFQAQKLLLDEAAIAPLYNEVSNTYVKPTVLDLVITGMDGALKGDGFFWKTKIIALDD
jgi:oligopeptide transport system substrate-binding protein